jgi:mono/diheme cytochrome c family protein
MTGAQTTFFVLLLIVFALALPPAAVAQDDGASLYKLHCAKCHGEDGTAKTAASQKIKVANLRSDEVQKQSDSEIFDSIAHGVRHKQYPHAFMHRGLTGAQIAKLVAFIRELPKTKK